MRSVYSKRQTIKQRLSVELASVLKRANVEFLRRTLRGEANSDKNEEETPAFSAELRRREGGEVFWAATSRAELARRTELPPVLDLCFVDGDHSFSGVVCP